jgi:hypothetical protein
METTIGTWSFISTGHEAHTLNGGQRGQASQDENTWIQAKKGMDSTRSRLHTSFGQESLKLAIGVSLFKLGKVGKMLRRYVFTQVDWQCSIITVRALLVCIHVHPQCMCWFVWPISTFGTSEACSSRLQWPWKPRLFCRPIFKLMTDRHESR